MEELWSGRSEVVRPVGLKTATGDFASQFQGWRQHDSHELITFLFEGIHEDLNRLKKKKVVEGVFGDGTNDLEIAQKVWENHLARNELCLHSIRGRLSEHGLMEVSRVSSTSPNRSSFAVGAPPRTRKRSCLARMTAMWSSNWQTSMSGSSDIFVKRVLSKTEREDSGMKPP
jgi:ubiquitin C-terminal hydrolase